MTEKKYLPRKHGLRDLREALVLRAKVTLTPEQQGELDSLYGRLDRLRAVEIVDALTAALDSGLVLRPERRAPISVDETAEDERKWRERQRTF